MLRATGGSKLCEFVVSGCLLGWLIDWLRKEVRSQDSKKCNLILVSCWNQVPHHYSENSELEMGNLHVIYMAPMMG